MDIGPRLGENERMRRPLLPLTLALTCGPGSSATYAACFGAGGLDPLLIAGLPVQDCA